jgi:putative nucleotidyltransferase with HDIG domain
MGWPTRDEALSLLREYTENENLIKHALAVEACMFDYAKRFGESPEKWAVTGLLHDLDYEKYSSLEDHPFRGVEILRGKGYPELMIHAILAHADHAHVKRENLLDKTLYAVDELTGFVVAVTLVRPSKKIRDVQVKSVRKKWKDKAFARGVGREHIERGARDLGIALDQHIQNVLDSMKRISTELGL